MTQTTVLADNSRFAKGCASIVIGTLIGAPGVALAVALWVSQSLPEAVNPFGVLCGGLIGLAGATVAGFGVRQLWLNHLFGASTLTVAGGAGVCLGEVRAARFRRQGGQPRARQAAVLSAELVGTEKVTYRSGTTDHTITQEILRHRLSAQMDPVPGTVSGQVFIAVPLGAPPSLALHHNRIDWSVQVWVRVPGVPDDKRSFTVTVLPVVAPQAPR